MTINNIGSLNNTDYKGNNDIANLEDSILDKISLIIGRENFKKQGNEYRLNISDKEYILLNVVGNICNIDMIKTPNKGIDSLLKIFEFCLEEGITFIKGKAQPQKKSKNYEKKRERLISFYSSFGFKVINKSTGEMSLSLNDKNLLNVIKNKIEIYKNTGKWPWLK